ncbi:MAG: IS21 family transposase [Polyangiaceae bacterium]|nr:IS21 family transposase [Polyangiaceae bacterium]
MAAERIKMRNIREILRQKWLLDRSHREIAQSVGVGAASVSSVVSRALAAGIDWEQVGEASDDALENLLYGRANGTPRRVRAPPDMQYIHAERSRPGVTLELLHHEYLQQHPDGYRYSQFCELYSRWLKKKRLSMRQVHRAGEKLFVDYSGKKLTIMNPKTGEPTEVELFVAVLGASNYTYAEATYTQKVADWIGSHQRCFAFLGGVTRDIVPDQLKSGVNRACRYEPKIQRTYEEFATHYGTTVLPARPRRPKDKAKAEVAVQVIQRWVVARLRNRTFFDLDELNEAIDELVHEVNDRVMKTYGKSRRELFEQLDRPALRELPQERFDIGEWSTARVNIDYHVAIDGHFYSVPYMHAHDPHSGQRAQVDARLTQSTVEIFLHNKRIASHPRSRKPGCHTTKSEHMPSFHRAHATWSPTRIVNWASSLGPNTAELVQAILAARPHPEQGYRSCLGILRLSRTYGESRLEAACKIGLCAYARSYRHIESILKNGLDRVQPATAEHTHNAPRLTHENVRGREYYH